MPGGHHTRKLIKLGRSFAVVIPPHVVELMHAELGDYLIFDTTAKPFVVISKVAAPPYVTDPTKYRMEPTTPD